MAPKAAKSKAKAKAKCIANGKASKGEAKGWSEIQQGNNHMGKLGAQAVMDQLKSLAKCGKPQALATYKGLKGTQEKLQFALQLKVDREAAFLSVKENHAVETSTRDSFVRGWLTEAQVARELGLINYNFCDSQLEQLRDVLEGLPQKPHDRPDLAAKGYKLYEYSEQRMTEHGHNTTDSIATECMAKVQSPQEHDELLDMIQNKHNVRNPDKATIYLLYIYIEPNMETMLVCR